MQGIKIIAVGRLKEKYLIDAQGEYLKRISRFCPVETKEIGEQRLPPEPSVAEIATVLKKEAVEITAAIPAGYAVAALCIEGKGYDSEGFSRLITGEGQNRIAFVIGGSNGLDGELKKSAGYRISMSGMTFPHHLARIMLLEQIYRGYMIDAGTKYHK